MIARARTIEWDLVAFLLVFGFFWQQSYAYEGEVGQMPRMFLIVGAVCVAIKLAIEHGNGSIAAKARHFDASIVSGMAEEPETAVSESDDRFARTAGMIALGGLLLGFALATYLIGFLFAIPLFALGITVLMKPDSYVRIAVGTVILLLFIYVVFGSIMNVPVTESVLL